MVMSNWLERAKREILKSSDRLTGNTAERDSTSVTAVPEPAKPNIFESAESKVPAATHVREQVEDLSDRIPPLLCWNCGETMDRTKDIYGTPWWVCWECATTA
jgi:hypothetical protein